MEPPIIEPPIIEPPIIERMSPPNARSICCIIWPICDCIISNGLLGSRDRPRSRRGSPPYGFIAIGRRSSSTVLVHFFLLLRCVRRRGSLCRGEEHHTQLLTTHAGGGGLWATCLPLGARELFVFLVLYFFCS